MLSARIMRLNRLAVFGTMAVLAIHPLHGQQRPSKFAQSIFVQSTVGGGTSTGGSYVEREEFTGEIMLGARLAVRSVPLTVGMALGGSFVNGSDLTCGIAPTGGCIPIMPRFNYVALLTGFEARGRAGGVGMMAGPALLGANSSTRMGAQLRMDVESPSVFHAMIVVSPRLLVVPHFEGSAITLRSLNFGVRIR